MNFKKLDNLISALETADAALYAYMRGVEKELVDESLKGYIDRLRNLDGIRIAITDLPYLSRPDLEAWRQWRAKQRKQD